MRGRVVALLLMLYLALDLASPMTPGVFQIVGEWIKVMDGCEAKSGSLADVPSPPLLRRESHPSARETTDRSTVTRLALPAAPLRFLPTRVPTESRGTSPSSPDDD